MAIHIHSFIHSKIHVVPLQGNHLEALPAPTRKKVIFQMARKHIWEQWGAAPYRVQLPREVMINPGVYC